MSTTAKSVEGHEAGIDAKCGNKRRPVYLFALAVLIASNSPQKVVGNSVKSATTNNQLGDLPCDQQVHPLSQFGGAD